MPQRLVGFDNARVNREEDEDESHGKDGEASVDVVPGIGQHERPRIDSHDQVGEGAHAQELHRVVVRQVERLEQQPRPVVCVCVRLGFGAFLHFCIVAFLHCCIFACCMLHFACCIFAFLHFCSLQFACCSCCCCWRATKHKRDIVSKSCRYDVTYNNAQRTRQNQRPTTSNQTKQKKQKPPRE